VDAGLRGDGLGSTDAQEAEEFGKRLRTCGGASESDRGRLAGTRPPHEFACSRGRHDALRERPPRRGDAV